jgi:cytochrome b561
MGALLQLLPSSGAIDERYDGVAKTLHWLTFGLVALQFAIGWAMPEIREARRPGQLVEVHMSIGIGILVVAALRLLWRLTRGKPRAPYVASWESRTAKAVQVALYLLLFLMPLSGWADASARDLKVTLFGTASLPLIPHPGGTPFFGTLHSFAAYGLLGLIGLHVAAALYHHFVLRDRVLSRMVPYRD